jgi:ketosteroid isomerase-like protein
MTHDDVQRWLDAYVEAWRSNDPAAIGALFAPEATYRHAPYREPIVGRDAIVADWVAPPDEPEAWEAHYEPFAVDGDRAVAIGESRYTNADGSLRDLYFNLWTLRFDREGQCTEYVEYWVDLPERLKATY